MTVKLNLTIDEEIVAKSKRFAARKKTTVSKIVQELLRRHLTQVSKEQKGATFTQKYAGSLKHPIPDVHAARQEYLNKKYGA
ncbi:MAG: hypothetical protein JNM68_06155 [Dinghuibacter sp.]|nr:hypothetical protein [Dinghuibacter sp.]